MNPTDNAEPRKKLLEIFDCVDTQADKQAVKDIFVEYHDIFAGHQLRIRMNAEFKLKLTPRDNKVFWS